MIRHVAELSALLLCFAVGAGLVGAFVIGLLWIWSTPEKVAPYVPPQWETAASNFFDNALQYKRRDGTLVLTGTWLDSEPFTGDAAWPQSISAFAYDWSRDGR